MSTSADVARGGRCAQNASGGSAGFAAGIPFGPEVDVETERLLALVDGLAVHAAVRPIPAERLRTVIDHHLSKLSMAARQSAPRVDGGAWPL